jgi:hypothetical protein
MANSPNDLTRQQLDDLDALLQRMLAVPIPSSAAKPNPMPAASEPPAPASTWRMDSPSPGVRQPHLTAAPVAVEQPAMAMPSVILESRVDPRPYLKPEAATPPMPEVPPRLFGNPPPQYVPPAPPERPIVVEPEPMPEAVVQFQPATTITPEFEAPIPLVEAPVMPPVEASEVPVLLWPLYGVNWLIESVLCLFGPPGEVFVHPVVNTVLGITGIGLLLYAAFWVARAMGIVTT